jgi:tRNA(Ile2)-agmatinylcytidine synthase
MLVEHGEILPCMAYEPTRGFRDVIRNLQAGDAVEACGSYKGGSLNLEKIRVRSLAADEERRPPPCGGCGRRMTSAGKGKGYKCRACGVKSRDPEVRLHPRSIACGWYEVPPSARRHLARPLIRGQEKGKDDTAGRLPDPGGCVVHGTS